MIVLLDIPSSDRESDNDEGSTGTAETVLEVGLLTRHPNVNINMDIDIPFDNIDYDAEGETDDKIMEGTCH